MLRERIELVVPVVAAGWAGVVTAAGILDDDAGVETAIVRRHHS